MAIVALTFVLDSLLALSDFKEDICKLYNIRNCRDRDRERDVANYANQPFNLGS